LNGMKHRNGFAPNFIHSLDSSHMMLTSLYLWRLGINFASVHDCYWTHACDVEDMNRVCREEFVALHSYPILESLSQSFKDKFLVLPPDSDEHKKKASAGNVDQDKREMLFNSIPRKGDLDLNVVKDSVYFFS
jgi:DNA-directed RNA polymerase